MVEPAAGRGSYVRGARRREQIVEAARELFVAEGYRAVSLRDIAAAAGLSHPGLLRHFAGKEAILDAVVDGLERANAGWIEQRGGELAPAAMVELAEHNAAIPGYVALFTMLAGEASSPHHPAHERMRRRYEFLRAQNAAVLGPYVEDPRAEAIRLAAVWDGLQLLSLYDPEIDVAAELAGWLSVITATQLRPAPIQGRARTLRRSRPDVRPSGAEQRTGYPAAQAKRAQIVIDATRLFARRGFHETSMQDVASAAGVSKSGLLYHFPTKEALLEAVLRSRDDELIPAGPALGAGDELATAVAGAEAAVRDAPGLIEVYAVLCCEATASDHPAHAYFRSRFAAARTYFGQVFAGLADQDRPLGMTGDDAGTWFVALWEGLQFQWLYDRRAVDVPKLLDGRLRRPGPHLAE